MIISDRAKSIRKRIHEVGKDSHHPLHQKHEFDTKSPAHSGAPQSKHADIFDRLEQPIMHPPAFKMAN